MWNHRIQRLPQTSQACPLRTFVIVQTFWLGLAGGLAPNAQRPEMLSGLQNMDGTHTAAPHTAAPTLHPRRCAGLRVHNMRVKKKFVLPRFQSFFHSLCLSSSFYTHTHTDLRIHTHQDIHRHWHTEQSGKLVLRLIELRGWVWQDIVYLSCTFLYEAGYWAPVQAIPSSFSLQPPTSLAKDHAQGHPSQWLVLPHVTL